MTLSIPAVSLDDIAQHGNGRIHALIDFSILLDEHEAVPFTTYSFTKKNIDNKIIFSLVYYYNNPWGFPTTDSWDKDLTMRHAQAITNICDQSGAYAYNGTDSLVMSHNYLARAITNSQGNTIAHTVDIAAPDEGNKLLSIDSIHTLFAKDSENSSLLRWIDFQESITALGLTPYIYQTANLLHNKRTEPWDSETLGSLDDDLGIIKLRPYAQAPVLAELLLDVEEQYINIEMKRGYFNDAYNKKEPFSTVPNYRDILHIFYEPYLRAYTYCVENNITPTGNTISFVLAGSIMNSKNNFFDGIVIITQFIHGELDISSETLRHLLWSQVALADVDTYIDLPLEIIRALNDTKELEHV